MVYRKIAIEQTFPDMLDQVERFQTRGERAESGFGNKVKYPVGPSRCLELGKQLPAFQQRLRHREHNQSLAVPCQPADKSNALFLQKFFDGKRDRWSVDGFLVSVKQTAPV